MCELLAMSSRLPTSVNLSLSALARHKGSADGWGVAFYDADDVRLYKEPEAANASTWLAAIQRRPLAASLVLGHIRHATRGGLTLANTQPFSRELGGRIHVFAHNGRFDSIDREYARSWSRHSPIGETDSEIAFCILLERLTPLWAGGAVPALARRFKVFARFAAEMRALGPANLLYSDGDALFVHAHRRMQADGHIAPPGLWRLCRQCAHDHSVPHPAVLVAPAEPPQEVMLFASVPLSDEAWLPLAEGEVFAIRDGQVLARGDGAARDGDDAAAAKSPADALTAG